MERRETAEWRLAGVKMWGVRSTAEGEAEGKKEEEQAGRGGNASTEGY